MHVCVVTARARVLWPRPDIYCNYYVRAKFKPDGAPGCYDARGNTAYNTVHDHIEHVYCTHCAVRRCTVVGTKINFV